MDGTQTPEALAPGPDGTQPAPAAVAAAKPAEPVAPVPAAEPAADPSSEPEDRRIAQGEFTRAQQTFAGAKEILDLPKTASRDDVLAAIRALKEGTGGGEELGEDGEPDPEKAELRTELWRAQARVQAAVYGEQPIRSMVDFINLARSTDDVETLTTAWMAASATDPAATGQPEPPTVPATPVPPTDITLSEGGVRPGPSAQPGQQARRPESGILDAVVSSFRRAGAYREGTTPTP